MELSQRLRAFHQRAVIVPRNVRQDPVSRLWHSDGLGDRGRRGVLLCWHLPFDKLDQRLVSVPLRNLTAYTQRWVDVPGTLSDCAAEDVDDLPAVLDALAKFVPLVQLPVVQGWVLQEQLNNLI